MKKSNPLFPNEQEAMNTFLLTSLQIASDMLKKEEVFTLTGDHITFIASHANEVGEKIASTIQNSRYHNMQLTLNSDKGQYNVDLRYIDDIIKDLVFEINIDWSKKTFSKTKNANEHYATWKLKPLFTPGTVAGDPHLNKKNWRGIAESFDSAAQILEDEEYLNVLNNLHTAHTAVANYTQSGEKIKLKGAQNMVKQWETHLQAWQEIHKIGLNIDYTPIILTRRAEANDAIKQMLTRKDERLKHLSAVKILKLFEQAEIKPVNDIDMVVALQLCSEIQFNAQQSTVFGHDPNQPLFEQYLQWYKKEFSESERKFSDRYHLKKPDKWGNIFKSVSSSELRQRNWDENQITGQKEHLASLIKSEQIIKTHIHKFATFEEME